VAQAQQPTKVPRIGYLTASSLSANPTRVAAFRQVLRELGYIEGQNIVIEWKLWKDLLQDLKTLGCEVCRSEVDACEPPPGVRETVHEPESDGVGPGAKEASRLGREAARQLPVEFDERHVASVKELQAGVRALRAGEVDAYFEVSDAMVVSQAQLIIDTARAKRLPTMFIDRKARSSKGALPAME
jgi:hypothetical protein